MDNRSEVREFLMSRRARVTPQQAGLATGMNRRVPGLRRTEVAILADVSVEYYSRLERGSIAGVSDSVLEAIARALLLDEAERGHLFDLARAASGASPVRRRTRRPMALRPGLQAALDAITACPAMVRNDRMDILGTNHLGRALFDEAYTMDDPLPNLARFAFLSEAARGFYPEWSAATAVTVGILRGEAGRYPRDKDLQDLIGELSTRSEEFRTQWASHNVRRHGTGIKTFHHHVVGDLTLGFEGLEVTEDPGLQFLIYTTEPGSASQERIRLLDTWAADQPWAQRSLPAAAQV